MAFCCVVGCSSHSRKKVPGMSFHEIPAREDVREKWIKAISRKNWKPSENSNYSRVCSVHFKETDFIPGGKYKRLHPGSVPSVFPAYPSYMNNIKKRPRLSKNIEIRKRCLTQLDNQQSNSSSCMLSELNQNIEWTYPVENFVLDTPTVRGDSGRNEIGVQADFIAVSQNAEVRQWKRKCKYLEKRITALQIRNERDLKELKEIRDDKHFVFLSKIIEKANENDKRANILLDQIKNFDSKAPKWSEITIRTCIILRSVSPKAYQHLKTGEILKLPARATLQKYIGPTDTDTGVTNLIKERLRVEMQSNTSPESKACSLIADEMKIQERLSYDKKADQFMGTSEVGNRERNEDYSQISFVFFVLQGLATPFKIPVAYYFAKDMQAENLVTLVLQVIREVEECGFCIVRLVTDNLRVNRTMMALLCRGVLTHCIPHPNDDNRLLFLSFDYCHVLKNIYSQFLNRTLGNNISGRYVIMLYEIQKHAKTFKPVRNLTRKHVFLSNIEKMHVGRAIQLFSPPVTAALKFLKEQSGKTIDLNFKQCGPTIEFMENVFKWFTIQDVSNRLQHLHKKMPDARHFDDPKDDRLLWLENSFLAILDRMKSVALDKNNFLTAETHEAIVITSKSAAACVRFLLSQHSFEFFLTRRFSSDAVESLFSCLRQLGGRHDQVDARAATHSLQKVLKTGIVAKSTSSNVRPSNDEALPTRLITAPLNVHAETVIQFPCEVLQILEQLNNIPEESLFPSVENASLTLVAGYIARIVQENVSCKECIQIVQSSQNRTPICSIIFFQDRGGLVYPSDNFIHIIKILSSFAEAVLPILPAKCRLLKTLVSVVSPKLMLCPALVCNSDKEINNHLTSVASLICEKFFRPLLHNYAATITNLNDCAKKLSRKPLSRKVLKL